MPAWRDLCADCESDGTSSTNPGLELAPIPSCLQALGQGRTDRNGFRVHANCRWPRGRSIQTFRACSLGAGGSYSCISPRNGIGLASLRKPVENFQQRLHENMKV